MLVLSFGFNFEVLLFSVHRDNGPEILYFHLDQYCQTWSVNILTRVCRELTRLSRSKHTLVNILTIGQLEHP